MSNKICYIALKKLPKDLEKLIILKKLFCKINCKIHKNHLAN